MGVPTSEVGYTSAMPRREDHEVRKGHVGHWIKEKNVDVDYRRVSDIFVPIIRRKDHVLLHMGFSW